MTQSTTYSEVRVRRARAILLTDRHTILFIKRIKPHNPAPYWVAPGGGVEVYDHSLTAALARELYEELGAHIEVLREAFVLKHSMGGKNLEEYFYVCRLRDYDLSQRSGPEFQDPARGEYIPDEIPLTAAALGQINIKTPELRDWLLRNLPNLSG